jgi:predicted HicB family RNase H-like nuclease
MWNELVKIIQYPNIDAEDKKMASMLLNQLKTASGACFLRKEIDIFVDNMVSKHSDILTYKEDKLNKLIKEKEDLEKNFVPRCREESIHFKKEIKRLDYEINKLK